MTLRKNRFDIAMDIAYTLRHAEKMIVLVISLFVVYALIG